MSETEKEFSVDERLVSVENQAYITYLMVNSVVKLLTEKGIISQDGIAKEMDELNSKLFEATKEFIEKEKTEETPVV